MVQVANFYGPRSGGLRTAVDRLGAEYCAAGHEVYLVVPGQRMERQRLSTGVLRITLPAPLIPFTGGYRAVLPGPITALLRDLRPHETFGLAALEALACGTPAVVSRTSALAEILTAGGGLAADNDPQALAHAVTTVMEVPEELRRNDARRRAEQFTWPRAAAGMLAALSGP